MSLKLAVVTASIDPEKTAHAWGSWRKQAVGEYRLIHVLNGQREPATRKKYCDDYIVDVSEILGVVPAFLLGIEIAASHGAEIVACLHDDFRIDQPEWDAMLAVHFKRHPGTGLVCFSGADGLGDADIYQKPYAPHQLARVGFFSNLEDAEAHGRREVRALRSACGDGFSQVGRAGLMLRWYRRFAELGVLHHAYDSALGAFCKRDGCECWYLPVAGRHFGGMTAVGSAAYQQWATEQHGGDAALWERAHRVLYDDLRDVLPIRVR